MRILSMAILAALLLAGCGGAADNAGNTGNVGNAANAGNASNAGNSAPAAKPYPLTKCIVTDEALGSMGEAISLVHEGQEVKFCCKSCIAGFQKDPAKYLAKLKP